MEGECGAYVSSDQLDSERKVGSLPMYSFFGENALLGEESLADTSSSSSSSSSSSTSSTSSVRVCNATVRVLSKTISLLVLKKEIFTELITSKKINPNVLRGAMQKMDHERTAQNEQEVMRVIDGVDDVDDVDDEGELSKKQRSVIGKMEKIAESRVLCELCNAIYYCNKKCQKRHWKVHEPKCKMLMNTGSISSE